MRCCSSCGHDLTGAFPDVMIVVERIGGASSLYCRTCAPTLVGVDQVLEDNRTLVAFVKAGGKVMSRRR